MKYWNFRIKYLNLLTYCNVKRYCVSRFTDIPGSTEKSCIRKQPLSPFEFAISLSNDLRAHTVTNYFWQASKTCIFETYLTLACRRMDLTKEFLRQRSCIVLSKLNLKSFAFLARVVKSRHLSRNMSQQSSYYNDHRFYSEASFLPI